MSLGGGEAVLPSTKRVLSLGNGVLSLGNAVASGEGSRPFANGPSHVRPGTGLLEHSVLASGTSEEIKSKWQRLAGLPGPAASAFFGVCLSCGSLVGERRQREAGDTQAVKGTALRVTAPRSPDGSFYGAAVASSCAGF